MQKIDTIEIKNFKSIRHQKIEGCRRINVFIGYPNVGKSNILEALSLFSIDEHDLNFSSFIRIENLTTLFYNGDIAKQSEIRINKKHRFVIGLKNDNLLFSQQFEREGTSFEKLDKGNITLDDSTDVSVKRSFQLRESDKSLLTHSSFGIGRENELPSVRKYEFIKRVQYSKSGYSTLSQPNGDNIFNIISTDPLLQKEIAELFKPYNLELLYESREQKFTILKRTPNGIFSIPYELVADTLQRVIFFKCAIRSNRNAVLLFEEPEAQMFPPYIAKLTTDIIFDENNNQFFIATHSPYVLTEFIEEAQNDLAIYLVDYDKGETVIKRLTDEQITEVAQYGIDLFFNLEPYLDKYGQPHSA